MFPLRRIIQAVVCALGVTSVSIDACAASARETGFPLLTSFSDREYGGGQFVSCVAADQNGIMYFGGDRLLSYDGANWRNWPLTDGFEIRGFDFGPDGKLWTAATGAVGWFEKTVDGNWAFHSLNHKVPPEAQYALHQTWNAFADERGVIFICGDGVLYWNGTEMRFWPMLGMRRVAGTRSNGHVYIHHVPSGLYRMGPDGPKKILEPDELPERAIFWLEETSEGLLVASPSGLFKLSPGKREPFAPEIADYLGKNYFSSGLRLPDGRIGLTTFSGGVVLVTPDGHLDQILDRSIGLLSATANGLATDESGGLWIATASGINRLALRSPTTTFDNRAGAPSRTSSKILRHDGDIFWSNRDGVFRLDSEHRRFSPVPSLQRRYYDALSTGDGLFLSGFHSIEKFTGATASVFHTSVRDGFAIQFSRRSPDILIVSQDSEIVAINRYGKERVLVKNLLASSSSIAEDAAGRIWIATPSSGIFRAQIDSEVPVEASVASDMGLPPIRTNALVAGTSDGSIYVLSGEGGWFSAKGTHHFQPIAQFPLRPVLATSSAGPDDSIWIAHAATKQHAATVARVRRVGSTAVWEPHSVEGLPVIFTPNCIFPEENEFGQTVLWIGGTNGVLRHVISGDLSAPAPRPPILHAFARSAKSEAPQPMSETLPYSTRAIEFQFAEPDYARRASLRLETKIDGVDRDWVPAGNSASREFTAPRDGHYTFQVRAVAETGAVSEPTSYSFSIAPPWWRTAPALLGVVFALLPLGYGFYRLRVHALRRRNAELEAKVLQRTEQLAQASAAKTEFVANMSHDIRNPLNGILGLALALEDTRLDGQQRELVSTLRECTSYLSSLVDDVLDFASIEAGRVELRPGPFIPAELLRSVVTTLKTDTAEGGAAITIEVDPALPRYLRGDAGRIQQILVNYVSNALKYAGGEISVSATIPPDASDEVEFAVTDRGPGIGAAEQATLFTKFTRLAGAREHDIPGAGLGLASCRLLADILGGSVGVQSSPGMGARFYLRLPLAATVAAEEPTTGNLPNTTVLLVEDTDYNAIAATAVLRRLGLSCERASTGAQALELFAARRFNLVLLDRNLPDMDGTEVARRMRELETDGSRALLLAATAYCTAEDKQLCLDSGMDAFVGKPLTPQKLQKVLLAAGRRLLAAATFEVSPEPAPASETELDTSLLNYLSDGTEQGLDAQVDRFLAGLADAENELARLLTLQDFGELAVQAHRILGQARMIGGTALCKTATLLETAAHQADAVRCRALLPQIGQEIAALTEALRHRRSAAQTA